MKVTFWKKYIPSSEFGRNVFITMSGTSIAQAITLVAAPVLSRIYSPSDYGFLGVFFGIFVILSVISTLNYQQAIVISKDENDIISLLALSVTLALFGTIISIPIIYLSSDFIVEYFHLSNAGWMLFLIPLSALIFGVYNVLVSWANRLKLYKAISASRIIVALVGVVVSLLFPFLFNKGAIGLIVGLISGQVFGFFYLYGSMVKNNNPHWQKNYRNNMIFVGRKYRRFPIYYLPAELINILVNHMPVFIIAPYAGLAAVGQFNRGKQMLEVPITHISKSIGEVFRQIASHTYNEQGHCQDIYVSVLKKLVKVSIVPFAIIIFFAPELFAFIFGEPWREAGKFSQVLAIMYVFKFVASPLSYMFFITEKQKEHLLLHVYLLVTSIVLLFIGLAYFNVSLMLVLLGFSLNFSLVYLIYIIRGYQLSKGH